MSRVRSSGQVWVMSNNNKFKGFCSVDRAAEGERSDAESVNLFQTSERQNNKSKWKPHDADEINKCPPLLERDRTSVVGLGYFCLWAAGWRSARFFPHGTAPIKTWTPHVNKLRFRRFVPVQEQGCPCFTFSRCHSILVHCVRAGICMYWGCVRVL